MAYRLQFFDEVIVDIQEAKNWYKEQKDGLEIKFSLAVEIALERITKFPTAYSIRYKNIRLIYTKTFPYVIHYYVDELHQLVVITAIVHRKRDHIQKLGSKGTNKLL
jgi:mRNA-degrading endonuclease RelE of RelBE toxin-antitoxin system